jgi:hypothetical protein
VDIDVRRQGSEPWGLRIVGGADVATVLKVIVTINPMFHLRNRQVEKVLGHNTPAHKAGLQGGDVLVNIQGELVTMMTHPQVQPALDIQYAMHASMLGAR